MPRRLMQQDSASAAEIAYRHIRHAIITGGLKPGETLREGQLATQIGVSRTPVREALGRLGSEGLVVLERYRRGHVAHFSAEDVAEIFRLRGTLEGLGARRAALRISTAKLAELERIEDEMENSFHALGWHQHLAMFDQLNNDFHAIIAQSANSPRLERILASALELPASIFNQYAEPVEARTLRTHRQHREIIDALRARNPAWAEAAMAGHLFSIVSQPAGDTEAPQAG